MAKRICFLLLALVPALLGQNADLSGLVTDPSGLVIPGASIEVRNPDTGIRQRTATNSDGFYSLPGLNPGTYSATATANGFKTLTRDGIVLDVAQKARLDLTLEIGAIEEKVTVVGDVPPVDSEDATVSTVVEHSFVENMPMNGRSFQTLIQLTPGVLAVPIPVLGEMGQFSINGQRTDSNYMTVDGVSANFGASTTYYIANSTGGAVPATNVNGGFSGLISIDAMQEFRIQTSTYAPEYGRQPGGQIQVVSRSGTDQFHGTLSDYFRNTVLDANDWFADANDLGKAAMRQNDFGGVLGGPIVKNKTFFFLSYEGLRLAVPDSAVTYVPSLYARSIATPALAPLLNMFPAPNRGPITSTICAFGGCGGPSYTSIFDATWSNTTNFNAGSVRVDHLIGHGMQVFGRYNNAPSNDNYRRGSELGAVNNIETDTENITTATAGFSWTMSPTATNELRFNYSRELAKGFGSIDNFGGAVVPPDSYLVPAASGYNLQNGGNFAMCVLFACAELVGGTFYDIGVYVKNISQQYNAVDNEVLVKGAHSIKFGADFRKNALHSYPIPYYTEPWFTDFGPGPQGMLSGQTDFWINVQTRNATVNSADLGLYVQDTWKVRRRLTLTYGLRYELELPFWLSDGLYFPVVTTLTPIQDFTLSDEHAPPFATNTKNFAPRVGLAYEIFQRPGHELVLRGGYGAFYDLVDQHTGAQLFAYGGYPISASLEGSGGPFPFTPAQYTPPPIAFNPNTCCYGAFDPHIKQPRTHEWNLSLQQSFGADQTLTLSYVGAAGRDLVLNEAIIHPTTIYGVVNVATSAGKSNYDALQAQFQRRLRHGLQALISYSWSHSLDDGSSAATTQNTFTNDDFDNPGAKNPNYGPSNFDIRQSLSAAVTYEMPKYRGGGFVSALLNHWAIDNIVVAHSATPLDVGLSGITFGKADAFQRPNVVLGQPLYLYGAACAAQNGGDPCPGGKGVNEAAFSFPANQTEGDLGRNVLRAFGAWQWDTALRREFPIKERFRLQFRAEAFNILNHPNFGPPETQLYSLPYSPGWGVSGQMLNQALGGGTGAVNPLYQLGGSRCLQLAMKFVF